MLDAYLNNTIAHYKRLGIDTFGKVTFANMENIRCRVVSKQRLIRKSDGEQAVSDTHIYTKADVAVGDKIGDRVVVSIATWTGFGGKPVGYTVYL